MSRQVNFFAAAEDALAFHVWLIAHFPEMMIVPYNSTPRAASGELLQPITPGLLGQETVCLVPAWGKAQLVTFPPDSPVLVDVFSSPVLEYTPSLVPSDAECVTGGRVYWAYDGSLGRLEKKQIDSIFRWIRSHTELLPRFGRWRIFPNARHFRLLRQWVGEPLPNPLVSVDFP